MVLLVTSSRRPSLRTRILLKELERTIPGARRIVRGKKSLDDLRDMMIKWGVSRLLIVDTKRGNPNSIKLYLLDFPKLRLVGEIRIKGLSLQVDVKRKVRVSELVIKDECKDEVSNKLKKLLEYFIPESALIVNRTGIKAYLTIECKNGYSLSIKNIFNKYVYPLMRIDKIELYRE